MNAAGPGSRRLSSLLTFLRQRGAEGATSAEIRDRTGSVAPGTDVSELRANGHSVACVFQGVTASGRKVYRYTLEEVPNVG